MNVLCSKCRLPYGPPASPREPRVLPCGDSTCVDCLTRELARNDYFFCKVCMFRVDPNSPFPPNKLFYEMQLLHRQLLLRRDWEAPPCLEEALPFRPEDKCLSPFCSRQRFSSGEEAFCSRFCRTSHEQLYY